MKAIGLFSKDDFHLSWILGYCNSSGNGSGRERELEEGYGAISHRRPSTQGSRNLQINSHSLSLFVSLKRLTLRRLSTIAGHRELQQRKEPPKASSLVRLTFMSQDLGVHVVLVLPMFTPVALSVLGDTLKPPSQQRSLFTRRQSLSTKRGIDQ